MFDFHEQGMPSLFLITISNNQMHPTGERAGGRSTTARQPTEHLDNGQSTTAAGGASRHPAWRPHAVMETSRICQPLLTPPQQLYPSPQARPRPCASPPRLDWAVREMHRGEIVCIFCSPLSFDEFCIA
jgi:hypothetical protein